MRLVHPHEIISRYKGSAEGVGQGTPTLEVRLSSRSKYCCSAPRMTLRPGKMPALY